MSKMKWSPSPDEIKKTNLFKVMSEERSGDLDASDPEFAHHYTQFHRRCSEDREGFWTNTIKRLGICFERGPDQVLDTSGENGIENPVWLKGARLNVAESCFQADVDQKAIVFQKEGSEKLESMTYGELFEMSSRVANGLKSAGFQTGDAIAMDMTMTVESVGLYLGIVRAGCAAVGIADSFAPEEIATRLRISKAKAIFTQDVILRAGKTLPLYEKVKKAAGTDCKVFVIPFDGELRVEIAADDTVWNNFLSDQTEFETVMMEPQSPSNILFSSGTTGDPKAIPWTHLTPIKSAADGFYHHDIQPGEIVAWPTNMGWMMGPWLVYAALVNKATIALYYGIPTGKEFGEFVQNAKVNMLGLVPSLVKAWRASKCMESLDWSAIKCFSSTGECSNPDDYAYLMDLAGNRPVIEYCGGTEIGGGYSCGTLVQAADPSTFSTPALGLDLQILDENGKPAETGELFIVPPSIGLSQTLLNRDHHEVYYAGVPKGPNGETLRRHGDQVEKLPNGYFRAQGRADDTMNLGGIKVSSAEIERVLNEAGNIIETAAIAINPKDGGPSQLIVYAVLNQPEDQATLQRKLQDQIRTQLNPLFKITDTVITEKLPRTASNKVMRRVLRKEYAS